ncbi:arp2/3 complex subunit [Saitoella coloradoensis]
MSFRKIDIDAYEEDVVTADDLYPPNPLSPEQVEADVHQRAQDVRALLSRGDAASALPLILQSPPYGPAPYAQAKEIHTATVMETLNSIKGSEIAGLLKGLSMEEQDTLMKYLYKGMERPEVFNSSVLLSWHEKLVEVAGSGCIVRVVTDRRTV